MFFNIVELQPIQVFSFIIILPNLLFLLFLIIVCPSLSKNNVFHDIKQLSLMLMYFLQTILLFPVNVVFFPISHMAFLSTSILVPNPIYTLSFNFNVESFSKKIYVYSSFSLHHCKVFAPMYIFLHLFLIQFFLFF